MTYPEWKQEEYERKQARIAWLVEAAQWFFLAVILLAGIVGVIFTVLQAQANMEECRAHGFSETYCATTLGRFP